MMSSASSTGTILLSDYKDILLAHESDYRSSKSARRREVIEEIIDEIASQGKGKLRQEVLKGLESVSQFFLPMESRISSTWT